MNYRLWVDSDRLTFVRMWDDGTVEVARRETPGAVWGPPVVCEEEKVFVPSHDEQNRYWGD